MLDEHSIGKHDLYIISLPSLASSAMAALLGSTISFVYPRENQRPGTWDLHFSLSCKPYSSYTEIEMQPLKHHTTRDIVFGMQNHSFTFAATQPLLF